MRIEWKAGTNAGGTFLRGYFKVNGLTFEETVARLVTASGQDPTEQTDGYKASVEFVGTFGGQAFTLYDYKGDNEIHIGGRDGLDVDGLTIALRAAVLAARPTPYAAVVHYDELDGQTHGYGTVPTLPVPPARNGEPVLDYGRALLAFILTTSCTATLSDEQLEQAAYTARWAIAAHGITTPAANTLGDTLHMIARLLAARRAMAEPAHVTTTTPIDTRPNDGPMARLETQPITRPPSGQKVQINF